MLTLVARLDQLAADFVGHALELSEGDGGLSHTGIADSAGTTNRLSVVSSKDDASSRVNTIALDSGVPLASQDAGGYAVVASMCVFNGVVEEVARVRVDVGAANKLDAEGVALFLSVLEVVGEDLRAALLVGLVCAEDDSVFRILVVLAGILESPVVNSQLESVLLSVEEKTNATLCSQLADAVNGLSKMLRGNKAVGQLVQSQASSTGEPNVVSTGFILTSFG